MINILAFVFLRFNILAFQPKLKCHLKLPVYVWWRRTIVAWNNRWIRRGWALKHPWINPTSRRNSLQSLTSCSFPIDSVRWNPLLWRKWIFHFELYTWNNCFIKSNGNLTRKQQQKFKNYPNLLLSFLFDLVFRLSVTAISV